MSNIDELREQERKELNMMFLEEYTSVQNDRSNQKLPRAIKYELDNLFVLRHQFFHTGYINMYLHPERTTDVEAFLKTKFGMLETLSNTYPDYKYALAFEHSMGTILDQIREYGQETAESMKKDVFAANLERCSELRMELDEAIIDLFQRVDKDWGTRYTPSRRLMSKEDRVAHNTRAAMSIPYESRGQRAHRSVANDLLSQKQLTQIKIGVGLIDREMKTAQAEFNARKKVRGRGLSPVVEDALVQLCLDRHLFHTTGSMRLFTNPDDPCYVADSIRKNIETLNGNVMTESGQKSCLPISFNFDGLMDEIKQLGREIKERQYEEPHFTEAVTAFCKKKDEVDMAIRGYLEATDREFNTRISPPCQRRENVDAVSITKENVRTVLEKEKENARRQQRSHNFGVEL